MTDWESKTLSEVCTIKPPKAEARTKLADSDEVSFAPMEDLGIGLKYLLPHRTRKLGDVSGSYTYFADGDVLLAKITPCFENGKLGVARDLTNGVGFGSSEYIVLRPTQVLDAEFLYYYLARPTFLEEGARSMTGAVGHKRVTKEFVESYSIPLPPLSEQRRIVAILDEAFEGIATAKTNAEKNLQNARLLVDDYLREVFTRRGEGWVDRTLDQVCKVERGSSPRPIKTFFTTAPDGVNWIKIGDTEEGGKYVYSTAQRITPEGAKQSRYVKEGDFILTNSMSFGRPYIMKTSGYIHDGWFVLRLREDLDADYFYYLLSSQFVQAQFAALAAGAVVKNISGDLVKKAVLTIPPMGEQKVIVERFIVLGEETDSLAGLYRQKLAALDELKKALLHQAFTGQLTARSIDKQVTEVA